VLIRLAWHASGTYDKDTKTGGSNYATMRFKPESEHGANNGLVRLVYLLRAGESNQNMLSPY
jgi:catalase (peroxidase I)